MGIIKGKFIVGAVGPVVYKVVKGKNIVSAKMVKGSMKQTSLCVCSPALVVLFWYPCSG